MQQLIEFKKWLDGVDQAAFHIAVGAIVMFLLYVFRRAAPALWAKIPPKLQPLPAMVFAAILAAPTGADAWSAAVEVVRAMLVSGVGAIGMFRVLKESAGLKVPKPEPKRGEDEIVPEAGDQ